MNQTSNYIKYVLRGSIKNNKHKISKSVLDRRTKMARDYSNVFYRPGHIKLQKDVLIYENENREHS